MKPTGKSHSSEVSEDEGSEKSVGVADADAEAEVLDAREESVAAHWMR